MRTTVQRAIRGSRKKLRLEKINEVAGYRELIFLGPVVVRRGVIRPFKPQLWPEQDGCADPVPPPEQMLGVS